MTRFRILIVAALTFLLQACAQALDPSYQEDRDQRSNPPSTQYQDLTEQSIQYYASSYLSPLPDLNVSDNRDPRIDQASHNPPARANSLLSQDQKSINPEPAPEPGSIEDSSYPQSAGKRSKVATLRERGDGYQRSSEYDRALKEYQKALELARQLSAPKEEASILLDIGACNRHSGRYESALASYWRALAVYRKSRDRAGEGSALNSLGVAYSNMGLYWKALENFERARDIKRELQDSLGQARTLSNMAAVYESLGRYEKALKFNNDALEILKDQPNAERETGSALNNLGVVYAELGQYPQALEKYRVALPLRHTAGDREGEGQTLHNIGFALYKLKQPSEAVLQYEQALKLRQDILDRAGEALTLNNLGHLYSELGQSDLAMEKLNKAVAIFHDLGNEVGEGNALDSLGTAYKDAGRLNEAEMVYRRALTLSRTAGARPNEQATLSNLGDVFRRRNQTLPAIAFYKQAVSLTEAIRLDIHNLTKEQQDSYADTVADTYRSLADLLLSLGRVLEAQQVMELLKADELYQFTRGDVASKTAGIALDPGEAKILEEYGSLVAFGQRLDKCKRVHCSELSDLRDQRDVLENSFNDRVKSLEKEIRQRSADLNALELRDFSPVSWKVLDAQPDTALIYPLVLKNKLWLLWATTGGVVNSMPVDVGSLRIGQEVVRFRSLIEHSNSDLAELKKVGQQLYAWLLQPLEAELKAGGIKHLVFAMDRVARYIPVSALFDGEHFLVERYTVSTILSASLLTDTKDHLAVSPDDNSVLALGVSDAIEGYRALPYVPLELDEIVRQKGETKGLFPGNKYLNKDFVYKTLRDNLDNRKILHLATHAAFVNGSPEQSYLLTGKGPLKISEINQLHLDSIHLVVLSACETALGGPDQDGTEISGISSYFLSRGAKAVVASLWDVNDTSTGKLMQAFYRQLAQSNGRSSLTKAEALRLAQLELLSSGSSVNPTPTDRGAQRVSEAPSQPGYSHPYYWAPFILIGNFL